MNRRDSQYLIAVADTQHFGKAAERRVRLVARASFPHAEALRALARLILDRIPNTVRPVAELHT